MKMTNGHVYNEGPRLRGPPKREKRFDAKLRNNGSFLICTEKIRTLPRINEEFAKMKSMYYDFQKTYPLIGNVFLFVEYTLINLFAVLVLLAHMEPIMGMLYNMSKKGILFMVG